MRFGITLFTSDRGITPAQAAAAAEQHGFSSFYVPEHTHIPVSRDTAHPATGDASLPDDRYMRTLDPWVALGMAAAVTERIRLGTCVALPLEHDPITLAKTIASLDHLSGGRVVLGAGFGWNIEEMRDHGVDTSRRRAMLGEYAGAMRALWTEETASYEGEFVRFGPAWAWPKPAQSHLPLLLGASGTPKAFSWLVEHADGWISTPREGDVEASVELLNRMWDEAGRVGRPEIVVLGPRPDEETVSRFEKIGVTEIMVGLPDRGTDEVLDYIARRGEQVRRLA
ncbi:MAG: LLM class F420-dependent oxidoreductase [Acidobacteriota bacterium]|nr:LLM class F420-dependent oxidoreductase [Acidobacteriota bacterium]